MFCAAEKAAEKAVLPKQAGAYDIPGDLDASSFVGRYWVLRTHTCERERGRQAQSRTKRPSSVGLLTSIGVDKVRGVNIHLSQC